MELAQDDEASAIVADLQARFQFQQSGTRVPFLGESFATKAIQTGETISFVLDPSQGTPAVTSEVSASAGTFQVSEGVSGVGLTATIQGVKPVPASLGKGFVVYKNAGPTGGHLVHRILGAGTESYFDFESAPPVEAANLELTLGDKVAALRIRMGKVQLLDSSGRSRLEFGRPAIVGKDGVLTPVNVSFSGCTFDDAPEPPEGRTLQGPGSHTCKVVLSWSGKGVKYPALLDPALVSPSLDCSSTNEVYALPADYASRAPGALLTCRDMGRTTLATVKQKGAAKGYTGNKALYGYEAYKVLYRTRRPGASGDVAGWAAAQIFIPRSDTLDVSSVVVQAHGTVGEGASCAPSVGDGGGVGWPQIIASAGWPLIATDYAGFAYAGMPATPAQGWLSSDDEARSLIDSAQALNNFLASGTVHPVVNVALTGESQGGHAILSAHAHWSEFASADLVGALRGVIGFSPVWNPASEFATIATAPNNAVDPSSSGYAQAKANVDWSHLGLAVTYFYGHSALFDGDATKWFAGAASPNDASVTVKQAVDDVEKNNCQGDVGGELKKRDLTGFVLFNGVLRSQLEACANQGTCTGQLAAPWLARWKRDRPPLGASNAPVATWIAENDSIAGLYSPPWPGGTSVPSNAKCLYDKLAYDAAHLPANAPTPTFTQTHCWDRVLTQSPHTAISYAHLDWGLDWIAAAMAGKTLPTCGTDTPPSGMVCTSPPLPLDMP